MDAQVLSTIHAPVPGTYAPGLSDVQERSIQEEQVQQARERAWEKAMMRSHVLDETVVSTHSSQSGGTEWRTTDVEVAIYDAPDPEAAGREAEWVARREADGQVDSVTRHTVEGPMAYPEPHYVVRLTVGATVEW